MRQVNEKAQEGERERERARDGEKREDEGKKRREESPEEQTMGLDWQRGRLISKLQPLGIFPQQKWLRVKLCDEH